MAEERSELEDMLRETYKTEKQQEKKPEEKKKKTQNGIFKNCGTTAKVVTYG